jgi:hypothetical protein
MDITFNKLRLVISEPWDSSRELIVEFQKMVLTNGEYWCLVYSSEEDQSFLLSPRYKGEDLTQLSNKKNLTVAVGLLNISRDELKEEDYLRNSSYYGLGSVHIIVEKI